MALVITPMMQPSIRYVSAALEETTTSTKSSPDIQFPTDTGKLDF